MGRRTRYEPGVFNWIELSTTDPEAATAFYGRLFGWTADRRTGPGGNGGGESTIFRKDGDAVAGLRLQPEPQRAAGVPPHWLSCVSVGDADAIGARAAELGGTPHASYDLLDMARIAIVADTGGAFFAAWQPREVAGAERVNDPGCLTMNELSTDDVDRAAGFYADLFGWRFEPEGEADAGGGPPYWGIRHAGAAGGGLNGGARRLAPEQAGVPPHWMPYITVADAAEAVATAADAGGAVLAGPIDLPTGSRIAVIADPQGAVFGIFAGEVDP